MLFSAFKLHGVTDTRPPLRCVLLFLWDLTVKSSSTSRCHNCFVYYLSFIFIKSVLEDAPFIWSFPCHTRKAHFSWTTMMIVHPLEIYIELCIFYLCHRFALIMFGRTWLILRRGSSTWSTTWRHGGPRWARPLSSSHTTLCPSCQTPESTPPSGNCFRCLVCSWKASKRTKADL